MNPLSFKDLPTRWKANLKRRKEVLGLNLCAENVVDPVCQVLALDLHFVEDPLDVLVLLHLFKHTLFEGKQGSQQK